MTGARKNTAKGIALIIFIVLIIGFITAPIDSFAASKNIKVRTITLSNVGTDRTLAVGEKFKLKVNISPSNAKNKKVTWKSSNTKVVAVSSKGVITAKKKGKAKITVTAKDGSKKKDVVTITVGQKVTSVEGKNIGAALTMKKGESKKFTFAIAPLDASNKKCTWTTSNKKIATVSASGKVTAKKAGSATITATANDGSGKKMKCKVTVGTKVSGITISGEPVVIRGNPSQLKAVISPSGASNKKVTWASSNTAVVKVNSSGKVTYVGDGKATITATAQDGTKKVGKYTVTGYTLTSSSVKFIAHRGVSAEAPENTIQAFQLACKYGFWGVECDIWETAPDIEADPPIDGEEAGDDETSEAAIEPSYNRELVISHDNSLARMTGFDANITNLTMGAIKELTINSGNNIENYGDLKIPTLEEYLDVLKPYPKVNAVIELKSAGNLVVSDEGIAKIIELLEEYGMTERALIISFSKPTLEKVKKLAGDDVKTHYLISGSDVSYYANIAWAYKYNIDGICMNQSIITSDVAKMINDLGMESGVYTVDDSLKISKYLLDYELDYITTNRKIF